MSTLRNDIRALRRRSFSLEGRYTSPGGESATMRPETIKEEPLEDTRQEDKAEALLSSPNSAILAQAVEAYPLLRDLMRVLSPGRAIITRVEPEPEREPAPQSTPQKEALPAITHPLRTGNYWESFYSFYERVEAQGPIWAGLSGEEIVKQINKGITVNKVI